VKYIGLLIIIGLVPLLAAMISSGAAGRRAVAFLFGASPLFFHAAHITVAPVSWPYWPGYVKGIEISLVDSFAMAVLLTLGGWRASSSHVVPFVLLIILAVTSAFGAIAPTAALFVAWQMLKVLLIYIAATRLAATQGSVRALIAGMVFGLGCNAAAAVYQHFHGVYQTPGLFDHQNSLGMVAHFVVLPAAALFAADHRARWALLGVAAGGIVAILGASRATIGLEAGGLALLIVAIALFWPTPRGFALLAVGAVALAALSPLAYKALAPRWASVQHMEYDEREAFKRAASAMMHDHPMGVGANHYVIVANTQGYSNRGAVTWATGSRSANVHNAYFLTASEMGYLALVPFVWLTVLTALNGLFWCFRSPDKRLSILLLGTCAAQLVVAVHNWFEWVFVTYAIQAMFCLNLGIMSGLIGRIRAARAEPPHVARPGRKEPPLPAAGSVAA